MAQEMERIGSISMRRKEEEILFDSDDIFYQLRIEMEDIIFFDGNKISKPVAQRLLANCSKIEK